MVTSNGSPRRTRHERVASLGVGPNWWDRWVSKAHQPRVVSGFLLALGSAFLWLLLLQAWKPPLGYRLGHIPSRAVMAKQSFRILDQPRTAMLREQAKREVECVYENRPQSLTQLRGGLNDLLISLTATGDEEELDSAGQQSLGRLLPSGEENSEGPTPQAALAAVRSLLAEEGAIERLNAVLGVVLEPLLERGLLRSLTHGLQEGNQRWIQVVPAGATSGDRGRRVEVPQVRLAEVLAGLKRSLPAEFQRQFQSEQALLVGELVYNYFVAELQPTLNYRQDLTELARKADMEAVEPTYISYLPGVSVIAPAGRPLDAEKVALLVAEWHSWLVELRWSEQLLRLFAFLGLITAIYTLCGLLIWYQYDRSLLVDRRQLIGLLGLFGVTLCVSVWGGRDPWQVEIVPLALCAMTATIVYGRPVAVLVGGSVALAIVFQLGLRLADLVVLCSAVAGCVLLLGRVRNRTRLLYVGMAAGAVAALTTIGAGVMVGQVATHTLEDPNSGGALLSDTGHLSQLAHLGWIAGRQWVLATVAGLLMTVLLPFVERAFGVQTDLSLLELGDASHPLLRQLAQRAPGTYNHSINVAAIAEAAAEAVGAQSLLVRVGAYFHDIGKMFKPNYFVENQGQEASRHDRLQPAMSTLVIIAHVKDGADLARQHRLPIALIDFIEQHHGTTLVEYFYHQAKKSESEESGEVVSELNFRYPGPKPRSIEAAIMMLADAVEGAARALVEPTPSRIQHLVDQIAMKRLLDGQFDECRLTLLQLDRIKQSLVKSLVSIYHGRVKYPDQQRA